MGDNYARTLPKVNDKKPTSTTPRWTRYLALAATGCVALGTLIAIPILLHQYTEMGTKDIVSSLAAPYATVTSATALIVAAILTFRSTGATRRSQERIERRKIERDREKERTESFFTYSSRVTSESPAERIGCIQGIASLADEWIDAGVTDGAKRAVIVICECLRSPDIGDPEFRGVYESLIAVIKSHTRIEDCERRWPGEWLKLEGAYLSKARLDNCNLNGAWLNGTNLRGARLNGSTLFDAWIRNADLSGAKLTEADLQECGFNGSCLVNVDMRNARFRRTFARHCNAEGLRLDHPPQDLPGLDLADSVGTIIVRDSKGNSKTRIKLNPGPLSKAWRRVLGH